MSLKEKLLAIKDKIHSFEFSGEKIYYRKVRQAHNKVVTDYDKPQDQNTALCILCLCEEDGQPVFKMEDWDAVQELPANLITEVVKHALLLDEKKQ